jgi:hypothetical protein
MNTKSINWVLRIAVAGEFFGHGMLSIGGKTDFIKWIAQILGTSPEVSATLLFWIGVADLAVAVIVLVRPINAVLLWAALWGFWTALVRPIVGIGWYDFAERFANWGAPLALLMLRSNGGWPKTIKQWFS